jgi:nucleolar protein 12
LKRLQRHILDLVPTAKIESTRIRSVPFQKPSTKLTEDDSQDKSKAKDKEARPHDRERTSTWRQTQDTESTDEKKFLTPQQKKKIAYINQDFHGEADTVNAYIVFAHPVPASERPSNVPPPPPTLDPYDAANKAVETCDRTTFLDRVIRVDHVSKDVKKSVQHSSDLMLDGDPKLNIFVGNLDFGSKEEDLRAFFEKIIVTERGAPPVDSEGSKASAWVTHVRIIRDKETLLGKGFAYVQFAVSFDLP